MAGRTKIKIANHFVEVEPILLPFGAAGSPQPVLLGADALSDFVLNLDFAQARLRLMHSDGFTAPSGFIRVSDRMPRSNKPLKGPPSNIDLELEGHPVKASLDLGSALPLHVSKSIADRYHLLDGRRTSIALSGSLGGFTTSPLATCKTALLAGQRFAEVPFEVFDAPGEEVVIGLNLVNRFGCLLNSQDQMLYINPISDRLEKSFPKDRTGLAVTASNLVLKVLFVAPGSPAYKAGWKPDDEIASIDGTPAAFIKGRAWKDGPVGTIRHLILNNGSERDLTLADYF